MSCGYPGSYLDSCTDHTQVQLSYQACTDVHGSEAASEQLTCLAGTFLFFYIDMIYPKLTID